MFRKSEYKLFDDSYFTVIRKEMNFIEFRSNATGHFWGVFSNQFDGVNRITVYHKKRAHRAKYDEYSKCNSVATAINQIKEFDKQFLKQQEKKENTTTYKEIRKLKVYESSGYKYKSVPAIVLKGEWLRNCRFEIGQELEIEYGNEGELVIRKVI